MSRKGITINDLNIICENSNCNDENGFVGIKYDDSGVNVFFPWGYSIPTDVKEFRLSVFELIRTISLSKKNSDNGNKKSFMNGDNKEVPIYSFIWIINDYLKNGLFRDYEKTYAHGLSGKINWKRTINSDYVISDNNIIFLNPIVEKKESNDNTITDIHAFCINRSIDYISWLYGNIKRLNTSIKEKYYKYYLSVLDKELLHTFDDRKKELLIHLKKILTESGGNLNVKLKDIGTYNYEYVWQDMVNDLFGNENVDDYLPSSDWHIINEPSFEDSDLRPDTILTMGNKDIYILDSKYYKYGITKDKKDIPHTESIHKQITYGEYVDCSDKYNFEKIYNAFILPYNKNDNKFNKSRDIEYIGFADTKWKKNNKLYEHVALILIDTKFLITNYLNNRNESDNIHKLVSSIQNVIDTFKQKQKTR